jgi:hypothetical protein
VLLARPEPEPEPELVTLEGRTSAGEPVKLRLVDRSLRSLRTRASVYCPEQRIRRTILWTPLSGSFGQFQQDGPRFRVRQKAEFPVSRRHETELLEMRGRLAEDGRSARGTLEARWEWRRFDCRATVRFSAD